MIPGWTPDANRVDVYVWKKLKDTALKEATFAPPRVLFHHEYPFLTIAMTSAIPQPPGVPLLGNLFDIDSNETWGSMIGLAQKYGKEMPCLPYVWYH